MGLKLDYDLTKFIPKKNVITPFSYHENEWIAPRSELPIGSLTESCSKWARMTHNEKWATEFFAFHDTHISESLHQKMASENFNMSSGSFDKLKEKITSLEKISEDALNKLFFECLDVQNEDEKEMGVKTLPSLIFKR